MSYKAFYCPLALPDPVTGVFLAISGIQQLLPRDICTCCPSAWKLGPGISIGLVSLLLSGFNSKNNFPRGPCLAKLPKTSDILPPHHTHACTLPDISYPTALYFPLVFIIMNILYILSCYGLSHPLECKLHAGRDLFCLSFSPTQSPEVRTVPGT